MPTATRLTLVLLFVGSGTGCLRQEPELVSLSEAKPLISYENPSPHFSLKVFMYAPGNFLFRVRNLLPDFSLAALPEVACPTGRILEPRLVGEEGMEFNVLLPGEDYLLSEKDVIISWVLREKGPGSFLRSEGEILVDVAGSPDSKYVVRAVTYKPAAD